MKLLKSYWGLILIVLVSFLPLLSLFHPGLPFTHDGQDHVARIANFYLSLSEGNLIPRWAANLNWGYGHPILMFLYPASSYSTSFVHLLGFSFVDSLKIIFGLSFILSGVTMYIWLREYLDSESAVVGALLYNLAPYRFVDLYVRGAIGEHVAFIFPPLVLHFLLKISESKIFNRFYFAGFSLSLAGLILAHNAISIMFIPFIIFYSLYLVYVSKQKKSLIYQFLASGFIGVCLSAFFLVPAFLEGKYTLRDIVTGSDALTRFVNLSAVIYGPWNYGQGGIFTVQVGILQWIAVLACPFVLYKLFKTKDKKWILYIGTLIYFFGSIFIMLPASEFVWRIVTTLQKFQFPWRFLSASVFASGVLGAFIVYISPKQIKIYLVLLITIGALLLTFTYWHPKDYLQKPEPFYSGIYNGTTDTGESAPIWSVRFMEHRASSSAEIISGTGTIKQSSRKSTDHIYKTSSQGEIKFRENTLYFPGWRVYIDGDLVSNVEFQDPANRGLMTFTVPKGSHTVEVKFTDTRLRTISNYVSLAALVLVIGMIFKTYSFKKKQ